MKKLLLVTIGFLLSLSSFGEFYPDVINSSTYFSDNPHKRYTKFLILRFGNTIQEINTSDFSAKISDLIPNQAVDFDFQLSAYDYYSEKWETTTIQVAMFTYSANLDGFLDKINTAVEMGNTSLDAERFFSCSHNMSTSSPHYNFDVDLSKVSQLIIDETYLNQHQDPYYRNSDADKLKINIDDPYSSVDKVIYVSIPYVKLGLKGDIIPSNIYANATPISLPSLPHLMWEGEGVQFSNGVYTFNPQPGGIGLKNIYARAYNKNIRQKFSITVKASTKLSLPFTEICQNGAPKALSGGTPSGGAYFVGESEITSFIPAGYNVGSVTITYTHPTAGDASQSVTVLAPPVVSISEFPIKYVDDASFTLSGGTPTGGTYSGTGVSGGKFDPATAGVGSTKIYYTYTDGKSCSVTASRNITVLDKDDGQDIPDKNYCTNWEAQTLATLYDGQFSIEGTVIPNGIFDPSRYSAGDYTVTYSRPHYIDDIFVVHLNPAPTVIFSAVDPVCEYVASVPLAGKVNLSGGTFSGTGISGSNFLPETAKAGDHPITYSVTTSKGCSASDTQIIKVKEKPSVTLAVFEDVCQNNDPFNLTGGLPSGGTYYVDGVEKAVFDPSNYDPTIDHKIEYFYTNNVGCEVSAVRNITVLASPTPTLDNFSSVCENEAPFTLTGGTPAGGVYSCPTKADAIASGKFYPSLSGDGNFIIRYTVTNSNGCTDYVEKNIPVLAAPKVTISDFSDICQNAPEVNLTGGSPLNGTYFVDGVEKTKFKAADYTVGNHIIRYEYSLPNGCTEMAQTTISVLAVPVVGLSAMDPICENTGTLTLSGGSPSGTKGNYFVNGINKTSIDLDDYTPGNHTVKYEYTNANGCSDSKEQPLTVLAAPKVSLNAFNDICQNGTSFTLTGGSPVNGTYLVDGVEKAVYNPSDYTVGDHPITYSVTTSNGCSASETQTIKVKEKPSVTLADFEDVCENEDPFNLTGGLPTGGTYYVDGVEKAVFDPSNYDPTIDHEIEYFYTNNAGCEVSAVRNITVLASPTPILDDFSSVCENEAPFTLTGGTPAGGVYSCPTKADAIASGKFYPSLSGDGNFIIRYTVTNSNGCTDYVEKNIPVLAAPKVTISDFSDICQNAPEINLTGGSPLNGTYFVDGVEKTKFNAADYTVGNHIIRYEYSLPNGCTEMAQTTISVLAVPVVGLSAMDPICENAGTLTLSGGSPSGTKGNYFVNGINKTSIDLDDYTPGDHTVKYEYTNANGCSDFKEQPLTVLAAPAVSLNAFNDICQNGTSFTLTGGSPANGTYLVDGVVKTTFNPTDYSVGDHTVIYEFTSESGCAESASQNITVLAAPVVTLSAFDDVCQNGSEFALSGGSPAGGRYFVNGVEKVKFNPSAYSVGDQTIIYEYTNGFGCTETSTRILTVLEIPNVVFPDLAGICQNAENLPLAMATPSGGDYSGTGISSNTLYPGLLISGIHPVTYTVTNTNGCAVSKIKEIVVFSVPTVTLSEFSDVCENEPGFPLTGGLPEGGTYSGDGIVNGEFTPKDAGVGTHIITYTYTNANGCTESKQATLTVKESAFVSLDDFAPICENAELLKLSVSSSERGEYTGTSVSNGYFNPSVGKGVYPITYTYTNANGCTDSDTKAIAVIEAPTVRLSGIAPICENEEPLTLTGGSPAGGSYSGESVINGKFYPSVGAGTYTVRYTYTNGSGCTDFAETSILVYDTPTVSIDYIGDICQNEGSFVLTGGSPANGRYLVNGIEKTTINPANLSIGKHSVKYEYTNANGCIRTSETVLNIVEAPTVTLSSFDDVCENGGGVVMKGGVPANGIYTNSFIVDNQFHPELAKAGFHVIRYTVTNENGCTAFAETNIKVLDLPAVTIGSFADMCQNSEPKILSGGLPVGGTYFIDNEEAAIINPANLTAGAHVVRYTYTNENGCAVSAETSLNVLLSPMVILNRIDPICQNGNSFILDQGYPENGVYRVNGTTTTLIDPSEFKASSHTVKYTYANADGCSESITKNFTVLPKPEVTLAAIASVCEDAEPIVLSGGLPLNGSYSGDGVIDGKFYPSVGAGVYTIRYTYTNGSDCTDFAETTITVKSAPKVTLERFNDVCQNADSFTLTGGYPQGGYYQINGVQVSSFDPSKQEAGTVKISYTYENGFGCSNTAEREITVLPIPVVTTAHMGEVCEKSDPVTLLGGSPENGIYSGDFVNNGKFYPELSGSGIFNIDYKVTNEFGCAVTETTRVTVNALPVVTLPSYEGVCKNGSSFNLSGGSPLGGTYFVNGVQKETFNPGDYTVGNQIIEYIYSDGKGCESKAQSTIMVYGSPTVELSEFDPVCKNGASFTLTGGSPANGYYTVDGIRQTILNPADYTVGDHQVVYTFTNESGCSEVVSQGLTILESPEVTAGKFGSVCEDSEPIKLSGGQPLNGSWTGEGVVDGIFYPGIGAGTHTVRYTVANEFGCESYSETSITVLSAPVVTLDRIDPVCGNSPEFVLNGGEPSGGYYTLNEQQITSFNPAAHEPGEYRITYTYENQNGCSNVTERTITVLESPTVTLDAFDNICQNADPVLLSGGSPAGGKYYINDVQVVEFDPSDYTLGIHTVAYQYSLENSCLQESTKTINVLEVPENPSINTKQVYCPGTEIRLEVSAQDYTVSWFKEDLSKLKDDTQSVVLQSDEPFAAYIQYSNSYGCKSDLKRVDINVETLSTNIETNQFEVEQGAPVQLQANVKTSGDVAEYFWEFSDGSRSFERNPWHYFNLLGENDVKLSVTTENSCVQSQEVQGIINVVAESEDSGSQEEIEIIPNEKGVPIIIGKIYPNPALDKFYLETTAPLNAMVQIFAITGKISFNERVRLEGRFQVNIGNLPSGMYILRVTDVDTQNIITSQKLIKK